MKKLLLFVSAIACFFTSFSQGVIIDPSDTQTLPASAVFQAYHTTKGVLLPSVSLTSTGTAAPVTGPATGLMVYNNNSAGDVTPGFYFWNGSTWQRLLSGTTNISGTGTTDYLARWTPSGTMLGIGATRDDGTQVGIGTAPVAGTRLIVGPATGANIMLINDINTAEWQVKTGGFDLSFANDFDDNGTYDTRLFLEQGGNVGVGTTAPVQKLEVAGNARITGLAGSSTKLVQTNNSGDLAVSSIDPSTVMTTSNISGTTNYVAKFTGTNSIGNSQLFDNGTNMGIGITTPGSKLHVEGGWLSGNNGGWFSTKWSGDNHHGIWYRAGVSADGSTVTASDAMTYREYGSASTGHHFWTGPVTMSERFRITNDYAAFLTGNVGIATTVPVQKLDVIGNGRFNGGGATYVYVGNGGGGYYGDAANMVVHTPAGGSFYMANVGTDGTKVAQTDGTLRVGGPSQTAANLYVYGNAGIGTTAPNGKFEVMMGNNDGIVIYQPADDNMAIQGYLNGQWSNRTTYAGGCCNKLLLQPDIGEVGIRTTAPTAVLDVNGATRIRSLTAGMVKSDASGNLSIAAGSDVPAGSNNYIQNQYASAQTASFWITGQAQIQGTTRHRADMELDGGSTFYFGREESFGGSDVGGADYGFIRWDNDNNSYNRWGDSGENGALVIGSQNDGANTVSDVVVLNGVAANIFDAVSGINYFTGNVGIGTFNPVGKLHVGGTHGNGVYMDGNDRPSIAATGNYPQMVLMSGVANSSHGSTIMLGSYDSGNSGNHKHWSIGTAGNGATFLDIGYHAGTDLNPHAGIRGYNGSTFMTILNSGYVGIGTTNPNTKLTVDYSGMSNNFSPVEFRGAGVHSWGVNLVLRTTGGTDGAGLLFRNRDAKNWQIRGETSSTGFQITEDGGDGQYGSGFGTPRLHVSAGGNVGIGQTAPNARLDISANGGSDGIAMGQIHGDNTETIQAYIDGQWANRASYAGGCCNSLLLQPDVGVVGIGTSSPAAKLHVWGNTTTAAIVSAGGSYYTDWPGGWGGGLASWDLCIASMKYTGLTARSDIRLKKEITELNSMNALDLINQMRPVSYRWIDERLPQHLNYGLIAQEVEQLLPDLVDTGVDSMQTKGLHYMDLIPILIQGMKEQQKEIEALKAGNTPSAESLQMKNEIAELKKMVLELKENK